MGEIARAVSEAQLQQKRADDAEHRAEQSKQETEYWRNRSSAAEARAAAKTELAKLAEIRAVVAEARAEALKNEMAGIIREADVAVDRATKSEERVDAAERRAFRAASMAPCTESPFSSIEGHAAKAEERADARVRTVEKIMATVRDEAPDRIKPDCSMNTASFAPAKLKGCTAQWNPVLGYPRSCTESTPTTCARTSSPSTPRKTTRSASPNVSQRSATYSFGFNSSTPRSCLLNDRITIPRVRRLTTEFVSSAKVHEVIRV
jgi:hypothetical protein